MMPGILGYDARAYGVAGGEDVAVQPALSWRILPHARRLDATAAEGATGGSPRERAGYRSTCTGW